MNSLCRSDPKSLNFSSDSLVGLLFERHYLMTGVNVMCFFFAYEIRGFRISWVLSKFSVFKISGYHLNPKRKLGK